MLADLAFVTLIHITQSSSWSCHGYLSLGAKLLLEYGFYFPFINLSQVNNGHEANSVQIKMYSGPRHFYVWTCIQCGYLVYLQYAYVEVRKICLFQILTKNPWLLKLSPACLWDCSLRKRHQILSRRASSHMYSNAPLPLPEESVLHSCDSFQLQGVGMNRRRQWGKETD